MGKHYAEQQWARPDGNPNQIACNIKQAASKASAVLGLKHSLKSQRRQCPTCGHHHFCLPACHLNICGRSTDGWVLGGPESLGFWGWSKWNKATGICFLPQCAGIPWPAAVMAHLNQSLSVVWLCWPSGCQLSSPLTWGSGLRIDT